MPVNYLFRALTCVASLGASPEVCFCLMTFVRVSCLSQHAQFIVVSGVFTLAWSKAWRELSGTVHYDGLYIADVMLPFVSLSGDALGIYPKNNPPEVDRLLVAMGADGTMAVPVPKSAYHPQPGNEPVTFFFCTAIVHLWKLPSRLLWQPVFYDTM